MEAVKVQVESVIIYGSLDPIQVFWHNEAVGVGSVTIASDGCAWVARFTGMSGRTIQEFFDLAGADYLLSKLGRKDEVFLGRIIGEVKKYLKADMTP